jgi:hypothetical protein
MALGSDLDRDTVAQFALPDDRRRDHSAQFVLAQAIADRVA